MRYWLWIVWLVMAPVWAQERVEVITLGYRTAEQLIPVIEPLVGPGGAVTGIENKLVVRTTPERLAKIREVVASLDAAPRRLMITVRMAGGDRGGETGAAVSGRVGSGSQVAARVWSTQTEGSREDEQRLQVLEGHRAFIRTGTAVPYRSQVISRDAWGRTVIAESTDYREVDTGFEVVPLVAGERVLLDIYPRRSRLNPDASVAVEAAATRVSGRLGEWIELGGVETLRGGEGSGLVYGTRAQGAASLRLQVKVEVLP